MCCFSEIFFVASDQGSFIFVGCFHLGIRAFCTRVYVRTERESRKPYGLWVWGRSDPIPSLFSTGTDIWVKSFIWCLLCSSDVFPRVLLCTAQPWGLCNHQPVCHSRRRSNISILSMCPQEWPRPWVRKGQLVWSAQGMASAVSFEQMSSLGQRAEHRWPSHSPQLPSCLRMRAAAPIVGKQLLVR